MTSFADQDARERRYDGPMPQPPALTAAGQRLVFTALAAETRGATARRRQRRSAQAAATDATLARLARTLAACRDAAEAQPFSGT